MLQLSIKRGRGRVSPYEKNTCKPHVFHMCFTCEYMWFTCAHMWTTCERLWTTCFSHVNTHDSHVIHMWEPVNHMYLTCRHMGITCVYMWITCELLWTPHVSHVNTSDSHVLTCESHVLTCDSHVNISGLLGKRCGQHVNHMWYTCEYIWSIYTWLYCLILKLFYYIKCSIFFYFFPLIKVIISCICQIIYDNHIIFER